MRVKCADHLRFGPLSYGDCLFINSDTIFECTAAPLDRSYREELHLFEPRVTYMYRQRNALAQRMQV